MGRMSNNSERTDADTRTHLLILLLLLLLGSACMCVCVCLCITFVLWVEIFIIGSTRNSNCILHMSALDLVISVF